MIKYQRLHKKQLAASLLIVTFFIFSFSTTLKSVIVPLTAFIILVQSSPADLMRILRAPWCIALLLLSGMVIIGCLFSEASWSSQTWFINKHLKFLYLPILAIGFQDREIRQFALHAFLAAMLFTWCFSVLNVMGWIQMSSVAGDVGAVFNNRVVSGFLMAFSAYLAALYSVQYQGYRRLGYVILFLLFSTHTFFINTGRTGYVTYVILLALFLFQHVSFRKIPLYFLCILPFLGVTVYQSKVLTHRAQEAYQELKNYGQGHKNTSIGFRLQFHQYAKKLFLSSPVIGVGTAGLAHQFSQEQPLPAWGTTLLDPHSQYWLMAADYGMVGVLLLCLLFLTLFQAARRLKDMRPILFAVLSTFLIINVSESFLLVSSTGYFFILFSAISLGEWLTVSSLSTQPKRAPEEALQLGDAKC